MSRNREADPIYWLHHPQSHPTVPTPLRSIPHLAQSFGRTELLVKDESANPFGTHKDRKARAAVQAARLDPERRGLAIITSGNAGRALAAYAAPHDIPVAAVVDGRFPLEGRESLAAVGATVVPLDLRGRRWRQRDIEVAVSDVMGRPCSDVSNLAAPYGAIADELVPELARHAPDRRHVVVVPVGGAELFVGLADRLRALAGPLGLDVQLVGATTRTPGTAADKLYCSWSPYWVELDRLTGDDSPHALVFPDESGLDATTETVSAELACEPSSALAFHALSQLDLAPTDVVTVVNTGTFRSAVLTDRADERHPLDLLSLHG